MVLWTYPQQLGCCGDGFLESLVQGKSFRIDENKTPTSVRTNTFTFVKELWLNKGGGLALLYYYSLKSAE